MLVVLDIQVFCCLLAAKHLVDLLRADSPTKPQFSEFFDCDFHKIEETLRSILRDILEDILSRYPLEHFSSTLQISFTIFFEDDFNRILLQGKKQE